MNLPEQIQKQVVHANTILEQHYGTGEVGANTDQEGGEPPAAPEAALEVPAGEPTQAQESGDPPGAPVAQPPVEDGNSPTFEQRWKSLQGIYNVTSQQKAQLEGRVQQLEQLIAAMQSTPPAAPAQPQQQVQGFLTDKDNDEFGKDMVDFAQRAALQVVRNELGPIVGALQALREELGQVRGVVPAVGTIAREQQLTKEERFFGALTEQVPDWKAVNGDQRFHAWLLQSDPMTGITRQTYLEDAQRTHDVARVANIFNTWKEVSGTSAKPNPSTERTTARRELEMQVAPGKNVGSAPPAPVEAKKWSTQEITQFYADVRKGAYKGREAEMREIERDIFVAQREGRLAA